MARIWHAYMYRTLRAYARMYPTLTRTFIRRGAEPLQARTLHHARTCTLHSHALSPDTHAACAVPYTCPAGPASPVRVQGQACGTRAVAGA
jgi:hypothetical protein